MSAVAAYIIFSFQIFIEHRTSCFRNIQSYSWLERYTDNVEVGSSTLPGTTYSTFSCYGGLAQLARAPALHAGGQRFESAFYLF